MPCFSSSFHHQDASVEMCEQLQWLLEDYLPMNKGERWELPNRWWVVIFAKQECPFSPSGNFLFLHSVSSSVTSRVHQEWTLLPSSSPWGSPMRTSLKEARKVRLGDLSPGSLLHNLRRPPLSLSWRSQLPTRWLLHMLSLSPGSRSWSLLCLSWSMGSHTHRY